MSGRVKAAIIVNPMAAGGRLRRQWAGIEAVLRREKLDFETAFTEGRGQATELARRAILGGCTLIVAAGGDGTIHDVMNGMVSAGGSAGDRAELGVIPSGTGGDFARTLGLPSDPAAAARQLARTTSSRRIDIGEVRYQADGQEACRHFINVAGLGLDAEVAARVEHGRKRGGNTLPYLAALVLAVFRYRSKPVNAWIDGRAVQGNLTSVIIGNGRYFGGGMQVAPHALLDDGQLEVIVVGGYGPLALLWHTPKLYRGTHLKLSKVQAFRGQNIRVASPQRLRLQADGELLGEAPASFRILPAALKIRV